MVMDIKIDDFKKVFFAKLDEFMRPLGYKYVKSKHGYILKDKNGWEILVFILPTKWSSSIGITTSVYAKNKNVNKLIKKITGYSDFQIGGTLQIISKFIGLGDINKGIHSITLHFKNADINNTAVLWLKNFKRVGIPYIDIITTDNHFAFNILRQYKRSFYFPDRINNTLVLGYLLKIDKNKMLEIFKEFENEFDSYKKETEQSDTAFDKWTSNYYKIKQKFYKE